MLIGVSRYHDHETKNSQNISPPARLGDAARNADSNAVDTAAFAAASSVCPLRIFRSCASIAARCTNARVAGRRDTHAVGCTAASLAGHAFLAVLPGGAAAAVSTGD